MIPPGADLTGTLVAAARKAGCTVTKHGPPGGVRVSWGGQSVTVPGHGSPGPRASAVSPLARIAAAALLGTSEDAACDSAARLALSRLTSAGPVPGPGDGTPERVTDAADMIAEHCEKVLAVLAPPPVPAAPARRGTDAPLAGSMTSALSGTGPETGEEPPPDGSTWEFRGRTVSGEDLRDLREQIWAVNEAAASWYRAELPGSWAQDYMIRERAFSQDVLDVFEVGFAPPGWTSLTGHLRSITGPDGSRVFPDELLIAAGLATVSRRGTLIDRYRNRVIFPVRDHDGHVASFGGRKHPRDRDKDNPKYLNGPDSPAYRKGTILYGLWQSRTALARGKAPLITEGYADVLAAWCAGGYAPVATCGTAFTPHQATALAAAGRLHDDVPVLLGRDPDLPGLKASARDVCILVPRHTLHVRFVELREDPADTYLHCGSQGLRRALDAHVPGADAVTAAVISRWQRSVAPQNLAQEPGLACLSIALAQHAAHLEAARALAPVRNHIDVGRQVARVALATGTDYYDAAWDFQTEWYPVFAECAEEAGRRIVEEPEQKWWRWTAFLPYQDPARIQVEGPPPEISRERLEAIAARDDPARLHPREPREAGQQPRAPARPAVSAPPARGPRSMRSGGARRTDPPNGHGNRR